MNEERAPWTFAPREDMTPEELVAMFIAIAPALRMQLMQESSYDAMPDNVKRHFERQSNKIEFTS